MTKSTKALLYFALALGLSACNFSLAQDVTPPPGYQPPVLEDPVDLTGAFPQTAPDLKNGAAFYAEKCLPCHGETGLGDGPQAFSLPAGVQVGPIGTEEAAYLSSPLEWFSMISQGDLDNFMPPFSESLSDQDIWDVIAFVYSFTAPAELVTAGETVYAQTCAACHGEGTTGPLVPGAGDLGDPEAMVLLSINDIVQKTATGSGNDEHVFAAVLDAEEQQAVAVYLRSQVFGPTETGLIAVIDPEEQAAEPEDTPEGEEETSGDPDPTPADQSELPEGEAEQAASIGGRVTGLVTNASGAELPEDLEITLRGFDEFEEVITLTTVLGPEGQFEFEDIGLEPEFVFFVETEYQGTAFGSEFYLVQPNDSSLNLSFDIYETTTDTSDLVIDRVHVFFEFSTPEVVQVINLVSISNRGDDMVVSERAIEPNLRFTLPEGASNLSFQQGGIGQPYVTTAEGFGDPSAVAPGESAYQILYAYELPYAKGVEWVQPLTLPTELVVAFLPAGRFSAESAALQAGGAETFDDIAYQVYVGTGLAAGDQVDLSISGSSSASGPDFSLPPNSLTIAIGAGGFIFSLLSIWIWFFQKSGGDIGANNSQEAVMDEIIALDQAFEAGELDQAVYQQHRAELKDILQKLTR